MAIAYSSPLRTQLEPVLHSRPSVTETPCPHHKYRHHCHTAHHQDFSDCYDTHAGGMALSPYPSTSLGSSIKAWPLSLRDQ